MADDYYILGSISLTDRYGAIWARFEIDRKVMASISLDDLMERYVKPAITEVRQRYLDAKEQSG